MKKAGLSVVSVMLFALAGEWKSDTYMNTDLSLRCDNADLSDGVSSAYGRVRALTTYC